MSAWHTGPLVAFDVETSGTDVTADRIVTASVVHIEPPARIVERSWLLNPGIEIPAEAAAIHGVTTERAVTEGQLPIPALGEIAESVGAALRAGIPVIVYNAPFDLSILDHELVRYGFPALAEFCGGTVAPIIDPLVIDRHEDRYRRGKRTLGVACETYAVRLDGAHTAGCDAIAAARLAWKLATLFPDIAALDPLELHRQQTGWQAEWAAGFSDYRRRRGEPEPDIDGSWPMRPARLAEASA